MSLNDLIHLAADLVALAVLVGVLYVPRHSRRDLMAAYVGVNIGVLAVTTLLSTASVGAGLGLGLFGVLSIIRLRSTELTQHEIAYFFAALALGLLGGLEAPLTLTVVLMGLVVASMWIADHPALLRRNRHQVLLLDHALADEGRLADEIGDLLGARVRSLEVQRLDLVNDTTLVDVRYQLTRPGGRDASTAAVADGAARPAAQPASGPAARPASRPASPVVPPAADAALPVAASPAAAALAR